jgi:hypothetical protein
MSQVNYGGFPSVDVLFDEKARLVAPDAPQALAALIGRQKITDLITISHGWNNDIPEAITLYTNFFAHLRAQLTSATIGGLAGRTFGIAAVFWPSKRFTDESAIPGGAAAAADARSEQLTQTLDNLCDLFAARGMTPQLQEAKGLVESLEDSESAQDRFVAIAAGLLSAAPEPDCGLDQIRTALGGPGGHEVLQALKGTTVGATAPPDAGDGSGGAADLPDVDSGPAQGGAADLGGVFKSIADAALGLLNVVTYSTMKDRAGIVGRSGLGPFLDGLHAAAPAVRLHLAGHSFGGRLVTAAAAATAAPVATLSLLQAAYSHYGLAQDYDGRGHDGFFRDVLAEHKVSGPILISHSVHDQAVGLAYPIASRILNQQASALGDENDPFGGMGRNGAQKTPEVPDPNATLKPAGSAYDLRDGVPNNLNGDAIIQSHGDICRDELAYAILLAIAQT